MIDLRAGASALLGELQALVNHGLAHRAQRRLAALLRAQGSAFVRAQLRHHAQPLLTRACADEAPAAGVSWFPVEFERRYDDAEAGLIKVQVSAGRADECAASIQAALAAGARQVGGAPGGLAVRFTPELDRGDGLRVGGDSLQLAVALAAASALSNQPLPAWTAWSGAVDGAGVVHPPSPTSQQTKAGVVLEAWGRRGQLCCPAGTLGDALAAARAASDGALSPIDSLFAVMQLVETGRFEAAEAMARRIMEDEAEFGARARYAAALRVATGVGHRGDADEVESLWQRFSSHAGHAVDEDRAAFAALRANAALDRWELDAGLRHLDGELDRLAPILAEPHSREAARMHLHGTRARLRSALGDHTGAIADGSTALRWAPEAQRPRSLGDLALWLLRAGAPERALEQIAAAEAALPSRPEGSLAVTASYLMLFAARSHLALGALEAARARWQALELPRNAPADLALSQAELAAQLGLHAAARELLTAFDRDHPEARDRPILSRLRARAEANLPDAAPLSAWAQGWDRSQLERLPY